MPIFSAIGTLSKTDVTLSKTDVTLSKTDVTLSKTDVTLSKTDVTRSSWSCARLFTACVWRVCARVRFVCVREHCVWFSRREALLCSFMYSVHQRCCAAFISADVVVRVQRGRRSCASGSAFISADAVVRVQHGRVREQRERCHDAMGSPMTRAMGSR